jgi:uncharacterized membrane protein YhfC
LNGFLMIAMPIGLAIYLTRKFHLGWRLWWIGAATFVLSQVGHIPFNALVDLLLRRTSIVLWAPFQLLIFDAIFGGLSAGLFEELFRYGMFRWWAKDARSWSRGLLTGAGHGGAEAVILGAIVMYGFIQLAILRTADLSQLYSGDKLALAIKQVQAYWSSPWYTAMLGAVERFFTIPTQIALAVIVLQTFTRKQGFWVWLAVLYHAVLDASTVFAVKYLGNNVEWLVGLFAVLSVIIIFALRQPEPAADPSLPPSDPTVSFTPEPVAETKENLDNTRYQ